MKVWNAQPAMKVWCAQPARKVWHAQPATKVWHAQTHSQQLMSEMHSLQWRSDRHSQQWRSDRHSQQWRSDRHSQQWRSDRHSQQWMSDTHSQQWRSDMHSQQWSDMHSQQWRSDMYSQQQRSDMHRSLITAQVGSMSKRYWYPKMVDKLANDQITNYSQSKHLNVKSSKCSQSKHVQTQDNRSVNVTGSKCSQSKHVQMHTKRSVKMKSSNGFRTPSPEAPLVPVPQLKNPTKSTHHVAHWTVKIRKMLARATIRKCTTQWDQVYFSPQNFQRDETIRSQFLVILHQIMCYYHKKESKKAFVQKWQQTQPWKSLYSKTK